MCFHFISNLVFKFWHFVLFNIYRRPGEDSDCESSRTTSSDESYEAAARGPRAAENVDSAARSLNKLMLRDDLFEYFERASPFQRAPLATKASLSTMQNWNYQFALNLRFTNFPLIVIKITIFFLFLLRYKIVK